MNILRQLRAERELSIEELAKKSGINPSTISMLENDNRKANPKTIGALARALEVSVLALAELENTTAKERGKLGGRPKKETASNMMIAFNALLAV